jgi:tripartite-type tricarboxylate transporter receptor subunit TctC
MRLLLAIAALSFSLGSGSAHAQAAGRMLVGYPPGGAVDILGRMFAERLSQALGRPFIVENRPGASGQIAAAALKAAAPDGNTLMVTPEAVIVLSPHTVKTPLSYNTITDFVPVAHVGGFEYGIAVNAGIPANDLKQWIGWARGDNKNAIYGSPGAGTSPQFVGVILAQATGLQLAHVPYKGVAPVSTDLAGGAIPAAIMPFAQILPLAKSGKIRILAHTGSVRSSIAPEIPTFKELGYPALELAGWYGIFAPAGMPPELLARYNEIVVQATRTPAVRERMRAIDLEIREMAPAEMSAMIKAQYDRWGPIVKASGYSVDSQ